MLEDWFRSFRSEALSTRALEAMVEDAEALLAGPAGAEPDAEADLQQIQHDRRIVTVCEAFTAAERELVLVLAALMRHSLFSRWVVDKQRRKRRLAMEIQQPERVKIGTLVVFAV